MKIIIISGPTGSGKTSLAAKIQKKVINGVVLSTDNYYKTGLVSKLLSKILSNYFDREISFNHKLLMRDLNFIINNNELNHNYLYNFKKKTVKKSFKHKKNIRFIIVEGIFARELINDLKVRNSLFIELTTNKYSCMKRAIKRDVKERGKSKNMAEIDFLKSWDFYYRNKKVRLGNNFIKINLSKENDLEKILSKVIN